MDLRPGYDPPPRPTPPAFPDPPPGFPPPPNTPHCGNDVCEIGEPMSCPNDCIVAPVCGDDTCTWGESCQFCPQDCGACPVPVHCDDTPEGSTLPLAVDGTTKQLFAWSAPDTGVYDVTTVPPLDITIQRGNCAGSPLTNPAGVPAHTVLEITVDAPAPTAFTLHVDRLPDTCGDGVCESSEACDACVPDCGTCPAPPVCGDGICEGGESCSSDCDTSTPPDTTTTWPTCGDGICDAGESWSTCLSDCPD